MKRKEIQSLLHSATSTKCFNTRRGKGGKCRKKTNVTQRQYLKKDMNSNLAD